jgi:Domain of unknown function (DUF1905)/Bacteriocin-protection, YdeI or OmpD-Associated
MEPLQFEGIVERFAMKGGWHYIEVPFDIKAHAGKSVGNYVTGTLNNVAFPITGLIPMGNGRHMLPLNTELRRLIGLRLGETVQAHLCFAAGPPAPDIPEALTLTLAMFPTEQALFERLPISAQRNVCRWLNSAKTAPTLEKRVAEVLRRLQTGAFYLGGEPIKPVR